MARIDALTGLILAKVTFREVLHGGDDGCNILLEDVEGGVNQYQAEVVALVLIDAEVTREDDAEVPIRAWVSLPGHLGVDELQGYDLSLVMVNAAFYIFHKNVVSIVATMEYFASPRMCS